MRTSKPIYAYNFLNDAQNPSTEWDCIEDMIESIPVVEAEPVKHGRWIRMIGDDYECSECKAAVWSRPPYPTERYKYCWSCGAKMDGGADNE